MIISITYILEGLSNAFKTPCVVFTGHPSLRFGDVVHFIELWGQGSGNTMIFIGEYVGSKAKGRNSKGVFQENKARQIFRKTNISYPLIRTRMCAQQGGGSKKCLFFGKFGMLCFPETPVLRFVLLPYYRRFQMIFRLFKFFRLFSCTISCFKEMFSIFFIFVEKYCRKFDHLMIKWFMVERR